MGTFFLALMLSSFGAQPSVTWALPVLPSNKPQTAADAEHARKFGRMLSAPEVLQPNVQLELVPTFAGSLGAKELVQGNLDMVFVSRELKPDDISDFQIKYHYLPLSGAISGRSYRQCGLLDAVALIVHKDNPFNSLSIEQLDALLSWTGHRGSAPIATWGDLGNPGKLAEWREGIHYDKVVIPIAKQFGADRNGICYSGLAFIDSPVKLLALAPNMRGPDYAPTDENVAQAVYPLRRLIFLNTNKAPGHMLRPALGEFLSFIIRREGQQVFLEQGIYLPLRANQAEAGRRRLQ